VKLKPLVASNKKNLQVSTILPPKQSSEWSKTRLITVFNVPEQRAHALTETSLQSIAQK
jgi:hypothetical protein